MNDDRPGTFIVRRADQIRAMSGPVAHQIVSTLERSGPCSVGDVASLLGVAPESLYYHVRRLHAAGILINEGSRAGVTRSETIYGLPGRELVVDPEARSPRVLDEIERMTRGLLRMAERSFGRALRSTSAVRRGRYRNLTMQQRTAHLRKADLARLNRMLREIDDFLIAAHDPEAPERCSVTIVVTPIAPADC